MYCRLRRGGGCDSRSDGSGELSGRRHTMQKIAYAASNRLPTLLKEEPLFFLTAILYHTAFKFVNMPFSYTFDFALYL